MRYWCFTEEQLRSAWLEYSNGTEPEAIDHEYSQLVHFLNSPAGQKLMPGHCRDNQPGQGGE